MYINIYLVHRLGHTQHHIHVVPGKYTTTVLLYIFFLPYYLYFTAASSRTNSMTYIIHLIRNLLARVACKVFSSDCDPLLLILIVIISAEVSGFERCAKNAEGARSRALTFSFSFLNPPNYYFLLCLLFLATVVVVVKIVPLDSAVVAVVTHIRRGHMTSSSLPSPPRFMPFIRIARLL